MDKLQTKANHLSAMRVSRRIGWIGAVLLLILTAFLSDHLKGRIMPLAMGFAVFGAACHYLGCELFARHFKSLADEAPDDSAGEGEQP